MTTDSFQTIIKRELQETKVSLERAKRDDDTPNRVLKCEITLSVYRHVYHLYLATKHKPNTVSDLK